MDSPAPYFHLVREMKDAYNHRLRLVESAKETRVLEPLENPFGPKVLPIP